MIERLPLNTFSRALHSLLTTKQDTVTIGSLVSNGATTPWATYGGMTIKREPIKDAPLWTIEQEIRLFSSQFDVDVIKEAAEDLSQVFTAWSLEFDDKHYICVSQTVVSFRMDDYDKDGFEGMLTVEAMVQQIAPYL